MKMTLAQLLGYVKGSVLTVDTIRGSVAILPHPGPLPLGEGESPAALIHKDVAENTRAVAWLPSPSGRG